MAINESNALSRLPSNLVNEKDEFVYRSYLALGQYNILLSEIKDSEKTSIELKSLKLLCQYLQNNLSSSEAAATAKANVLSTVQGMCPSYRWNKTFVLVAVTMFLYENNHKDALRLMLASSSNDIEL